MTRNLKVVLLGLVVSTCASTNVSYGQGLHGKPASFRGVIKEKLYVKGTSNANARVGVEIDSQAKSYESDRGRAHSRIERQRLDEVQSAVGENSEAEVGPRVVHAERTFSGLDPREVSRCPFDSIEDQVNYLRVRTDGPLDDDLGTWSAQASAYGEAKIPRYYLVPGYIYGVDPPHHLGHLRTATTKVTAKFTISCDVGNDTMTAGKIRRTCGPSWYSAEFDNEAKKWRVQYKIDVERWRDVDDGQQDGIIEDDYMTSDHNLDPFEETIVFICGRGHYQTGAKRRTAFPCSAETMYQVEPRAGNLAPGPLEDETSITVLNKLEVTGTLYDPPTDDIP